MTRKTNPIEESMIRGMREAVAFERGELRGVRVRRVPITRRGATVAPAPTFTAPRIARLRRRLGVSQHVFADALNVSRETIRAWEQGKRTPDGAALRLLQVADEHPEVILAHVTATATRGAASAAR